jgi:hypothetical protein
MQFGYMQQAVKPVFTTKLVQSAAAVNDNMLVTCFSLENQQGEESQRCHLPLQGTIAVLPAAAWAQKPGDERLGHVLVNGTLYLMPLVTTVVVVVPPVALAGALVPAALFLAGVLLFFAGTFFVEGLAAPTLAAARSVKKKKVKNLAMFDVGTLCFRTSGICYSFVGGCTYTVQQLWFQLQMCCL